MTAVTLEHLGDKRVKVTIHNDTARDVFIEAIHLDPDLITTRSFSFLSQPTPRRRNDSPRVTGVVVPPGDVIERVYDMGDYFAHPSGPMHMYVPVCHYNPERGWWAVSNVVTI